MNLFLYNYNNYYNRMVKGHDNIADYGNPLFVWQGDFPPGDGINTEIVVNYDGADKADYLLVANGNNIVSRWFVLDNRRLRMGQYKLSLQRDVVYDNLTAILTSPCFIKRATLSLNNNLIFNKEGLTFNQVKTGEYPLKDDSECPWLVGYIARNTPETTVATPLSVPANDYEVDSFDDYEYNQYSIENGRAIMEADESVQLIFRYAYNQSGGYRNISISLDKYGNALPLTDPTYGANEGGYNYISALPGQSTPVGYTVEYKEGILNELRWSLQEALQYTVDFANVNYPTELGVSVVPDIEKEAGKIIKVGYRYYRIGVQRYTNAESLTFAISDTSSTLGAKVAATANYMNDWVSIISPHQTLLNVVMKVKQASIYYEEIEIEQVRVVINGGDSRAHCDDSPYDIFAMPYTNFYIANETGIKLQEAQIKAAMAISVALGENLYDLQLLPYCPLPMSMVGQRGALTEFDPEIWVGDEKDAHYQPLKNIDGTSILGALFWLDKSSFQVPVYGLTVAAPYNAINCKVMNETKLYRLCSPNYNGAFEINPAKNNGLSGFTAYCSYKPGSPYIQVAPTFGRLYGGNYGDARGLICGGDFSLPRVSDAWVSYVNNNKMYQVIFDRQFQNLETTNDIAMAQQVASASVGVLTDAIQGIGIGAMAGGSAFGPVGGIVGGVAGGLGLGGFSAVGGIADSLFLAKSQKEATSYMKDIHNLQLGSIKAQPYSLTRVSAFNINNKIFPFVEVYEATGEEEAAFIKYLEYSGMTVNAIGTIATYLQSTPSFIQGDIIRLEINDDYHMVSKIAEEISKGVYI